ncbi:MAG: DUF3604 domain-containing protein [Woeseiaceae bacterium]|nr:DUF3604 domain-containing protein [Woeseiaceae bacterium]
MKQTTLFLAIGACICFSSSAFAQDVPRPTDEQLQKLKSVDYSPYPQQHFPNKVYFGETHLHTSYSTDAGMIGNTLGPEDAFRIARGEPFVSSMGVPGQLSRPFDFVVVSDHSENLGLAPAVAASDPTLLAVPWGKELHDKVKAGKPMEAFDMFVAQIFKGEDPLAGSELPRTYWNLETAAAEKYNEPGLFTALIGYEWSSAPGGANLHRNLIFRDGKDKADTIIPFSSYDSVDPEDLWDFMEAYEKNTGGKVLAIAHNGNLSDGLMFDDVTLTTKEPLDQDYAERRMRLEPIYEVTQIKGDGETLPALSPSDEFADYYTWEPASFSEKTTTPEMLPNEYAREALKRGLAFEEEIGANPFKFGMIGSIDAHTSIPSTEEDSFFGKISAAEPSGSPLRYEELVNGRLSPDPDTKTRLYESMAGGLTAIWARENTREALWDAMARKEVFATTGTRLRVRVFGGWDLAAADLERSNFAEHGYDHGVPMGGDLAHAPDGKAPTMLIRVLRDPDGANLDRIQIIKGWLDKDGNTHERIYDAACADGRGVKDRRCESPVGNTVNVADASYSNSIGDPFMAAAWTDPDFDAEQRAFYYVRVLEIPTPTWLAFDVKYFDIDLPDDALMQGQERAYTSAIWYTP